MSKKIWEHLLKDIKNEFGVAGLMGNLYAESGLRSDNVENRVHLPRDKGGLGVTDAEYIASVDNGTYPESTYRKDGYGIGLAQWTYHTRKAALYDYAKEKSVSIGDEQMQLNFLIKELKQSYKSVWNTLCNAQSVREASDVVLLEFERPADQSKGNCERRASLGQKYYDEYASGYSEPEKETESAKSYIVYEVVYGDTLSKIACEHNVTVDELAEFNGIVNKNLIRVGDEIKIPTESKVEMTEYAVVRGDNLSKIGAKFDVPWKEIAELNGITSPYTIYVGQKIKIPVTKTSVEALKEITYTVEKGDTLSGIGVKFDVPWREIAKLNNIEGPKYVIRTGQTIKIPKG